MNEHEIALRNVLRARASSRYGLWGQWAIALAVAGYAIWAMAQNRNFGWQVAGEFLLDPTILQGLLTTLGLTLVSMVLGTILGLVLAIWRIGDNSLLQRIAGLYIWIFRGTPLLVQLIFWYNLSTLFPTISLGLPFGHVFATWNTNDLISPLTAAIAGLALNEAAYMAEIIRAGLLSVDSRQMETAQSFGMTRSRALRRVVIPQAMRSILPPAGNQLISMIKATSLVSVIAMSDLLYSAQTIYNRNFQVIPLLLVAVIWYLFITSILNIIQSRIEIRFSRGHEISKKKIGIRPPFSLRQCAVRFKIFTQPKRGVE